ncbi:uncharacterized protein C8Q71DRAFT_321934 [Rhodofomes roseus]|uniref:Protein kinase domain-containing protein n=1 Tax=Rhodofomes roseus TaxID=34475 RepID=A0ABQ8K237_9APHY|nr:uncharacterized protein C8Q71DRAFT_321934 [Rhodofomes roseus]KAH9830783.1 hypothetical protein C8Q71DRAFT_321934 [Rhodofomes roseus]
MLSYHVRLWSPATALVGLATAAVALRVYLSWADKRRNRGRSNIRDTLPRDLNTWRLIDSVEEAGRVWEAVRLAFAHSGIFLWSPGGSASRADPNHTKLSNGFAYLTPTRGEAWLRNLEEFSCHNELTRGGTTADGLHVVIRVASIGDEGKRHAEILRKLARGTKCLFMDNHVVPLWREVQFEDIGFIVSPFVAHSMKDCYGWWAENSVGDIVDMILQALEAIVFVHDLGIVHRDLCKSNYVVQWHPESLKTNKVPLCRPRAFLTDFEMAYEFPAEVASEDRLLIGTPIKDYQRPVPPEISSGEPYDPFKSDVWQLAESFSDFRATVSDIDAILGQMFDTDASQRLSAVEARDKLAAVVHNLPAASLLIPPTLVNFRRW